MRATAMLARMLLASDHIFSVERVRWAHDAEVWAIRLALLGIVLLVLAVLAGRRPTVRLAGGLAFIALSVLVPLAGLIALTKFFDTQPRIPLDDKGFYMASCTAALVDESAPRGRRDIRNPIEACREAGQDEVTIAKSLLLGAATLCSAAGVLLVWGRLRSSPPGAAREPVAAPGS